MEHRRKHKRYPHVVDAKRDLLRIEVDFDPKLSQNVGASAFGAGGAITVLRYWLSRSGNDKRRRRRDIECAASITARPAGVYNASRNAQRLSFRPHYLGESRDLVDGLSLQSQSYDESPELSGSSVAVHDLGHDLCRFLRRKRFTLSGFGYSFLDHKV
jgi:hypothetical protein